MLWFSPRDPKNGVTSTASERLMSSLHELLLELLWQLPDPLQSQLMKPLWENHADKFDTILRLLATWGDSPDHAALCRNDPEAEARYSALMQVARYLKRDAETSFASIKRSLQLHNFKFNSTHSAYVLYDVQNLPTSISRERVSEVYKQARHSAWIES